MKKYQIDFTTQFKKDLKLAKKQNRNIDELFNIVDILASGEKLEAKYKDHKLKGNYEGYRECHIQPDWLLIYYIQDDILVLTLARTGTRSDLF